LTLTLREGTKYRHVSLQLVSVGAAGVRVKYFDRGGNLLKEDVVANTGSGVGCQRKNLVSYAASGSTTLGRVEIAGNGDGFGIDDVSLSETVSASTPDTDEGADRPATPGATPPSRPSLWQRLVVTPVLGSWNWAVNFFGNLVR